MNNPQKVEEIVRDYEDGELLIDWHAHDDLASIIRKDRLAHKTAMLEAIKGEREVYDELTTPDDFRLGRNTALDTAKELINKIYE